MKQNLPLFIPLPPDITIGAEVNSGRADWLTLSDINEERFALISSSETEITSVVAAPPSVEALSKAVVRVKIS